MEKFNRQKAKSFLKRLNNLLNMNWGGIAININASTGKTLTFLWTVVGIILIGAIPKLFVGISIDFVGYLKEIGTIVNQLTHPGNIVYINSESGIKRVLFPEILQPYFFSLRIFFASFLLSLILGLSVSIITSFIKSKYSQAFRISSLILESLPDIFIIILFQYGIIWYYKKSGHLLLNIASVGTDYAYLLPIICLSILPTALFVRIMSQVIEEETAKTYIEMARSKGLSNMFIFFVHLLRNTLYPILIHSKSVLWFMLSNLLVLEYIFNIYGIMGFLLDYFTPTILTVVILLLYIPIYFVLSLCQLLIERVTSVKVEF